VNDLSPFPTLPLSLNSLRRFLALPTKGPALSALVDAFDIKSEPTAYHLTSIKHQAPSASVSLYLAHTITSPAASISSSTLHQSSAPQSIPRYDISHSAWLSISAIPKSLRPGTGKLFVCNSTATLTREVTYTPAWTLKHHDHLPSYADHPQSTPHWA
jgi:hypothetical protein